jgi:signal transduction histidine kinase
MHPLRSVGVQLSLALASVVAGALALVWFALAPTLERRLADGKEHQLVNAAQTLGAQAETALVDQDFIDQAARTTNARVVYLEPVFDGRRTTLRTRYASAHLTRLAAASVVKDPVALRAASRHVLERGRVSRGGESYAEVAVADRAGKVILLSASLRDTLDNVRLIRSRLIWAGLLALGLAVLVGWGAASAFARRIRRLERAADRIAAGDFSQPVVDRGADELGQLASAFDRMRLQLAQLDDARRAFIANASHELRTPIFSLSGFLELMREEELDEETRAEFLGTMTEQVGRLSKLATDLLDLSRLDAGELRPQRELVHLGELARDLCEEFAAVALRGGYALEAAVDDDGVVLADRERVLQIGRALIDNALLHTPRGSRLRVLVYGNTLAIEDDGPGIPAESQERVFTRFTRLEGVRTSGTGLGLAIARELAQRMDGELLLDSRPGRTTFALRLPAARAAEHGPMLAPV